MQTPGGLSALRLAGAALLALCLLRLWHLLILRQHLDQPGIVALWLAATVVLLVVLRRPTRVGVIFLCLFAAFVFLFHWGFERAASDGREYFVQVRSIVMDRDLDFTNENAIFGARGAAKMYPIGVAILWMPFFLLAHAWLGILNLFGGLHSMDGFTNPYQRAVGLGTLIYGCIGLLLIRRVIRDYFDEMIATTATIAVAVGTFFVWYLTVENSMTHGASMFAATLFLYIWHRGRPGRSTGDAGYSLAPRTAWWIALGLAAGLMTLVRWQNIMFAALAVLVSAWQIRRAGWPAIRGVLVFSASAFLAFLPQLVFWRVVRGSFLSVPAADHGFSLTSLHIADILFSPNHGLLSTTPLVYLALFGLPFFVRRDGPLAVVLIGGFLIQVIVNSGSGDWWGGPGFGARRFDSSLLAFGIGLASLIAWLRRRPLVAPLVMVSMLLAVNLTLMMDVRRQALPASEAITVNDAMNSVASRIGNPFSFPYNAYIAWRYDADWGLYDRLKGRTYSNIEIDIGETGDDMFLGHGWLTPERDGAMSFRWTSGRPATVVVPLRAPAPYRLEFVCEPLEIPGSVRQTIVVTVNHARIAQVALQPGMSRYQVEIPASAWRPNMNLIQFVFDHAIVPRDAGLSADARALAVKFDSLRLRVITGSAP